MLILSKKKDYYDGVVGTMGIDKTLVYNRDTIDVDNRNMPSIFKGTENYWGTQFRETVFHKIAYHSIKKEFRDRYDENAHFIVGFCGKLYVGLKLYKEINPIDHSISTEITYDIDFIKTVLEARGFRNNLEDSIRDILAFDALPVFRELGVPVFVFDKDFGRTHFDKKRSSLNEHTTRFFLNPLLKDYEFYKVFDSFQAFQEVSMFMGGVLGRGEKDIVEVQDKYKIAQHGFDKFSFRKDKESKG